MSDAFDFEADPARLTRPETGIYVRARVGGKWQAVDLSHLSRDSLYAWLRSRGGSNPWAENTVALLLGHEAEDEPPPPSAWQTPFGTPP